MMNPFVDMGNHDIRSKFQGISNVSDLASFLQISRKSLAYYSNKKFTERHYEVFEIPKKSGGTRIIEAPKDAIKLIQRKLAYAISLNYTPLNCVAGFAQGRGVTYGAKKHRKQREVLNFDLDNFFPSIAQNRVFGVFRQFFKFNFQVSSILRRLVCYHDHLIQGAPTSPVLSNIILYAFDKQMLELARRTKTVYTGVWMI